MRSLKDLTLEEIEKCGWGGFAPKEPQKDDAVAFMPGFSRAMDLLRSKLAAR